MTWTQIDENEIKPNEEKLEAILKLKSPEKTKDIKTFLGAIQYMAKYLPKLSEQTDRLRKLLKKNEQWKWGPEQETEFNRIKQMLTEGTCLAHYAKGKDNLVTTDAVTTGLGITLWQKQNDGNTKPIAYGSRYLNETEKKIFNRRIENIGSGVGIREIPISSLRKGCLPLYRPPSIRATHKKKPK